MGYIFNFIYFGGWLKKKDCDSLIYTAVGYIFAYGSIILILVGIILAFITPSGDGSGRSGRTYITETYSTDNYYNNYDSRYGYDNSYNNSYDSNYWYDNSYDNDYSYNYGNSSDYDSGYSYNYEDSSDDWLGYDSGWDDSGWETDSDDWGYNDWNTESDDYDYYDGSADDYYEYDDDWGW